MFVDRHAANIAVVLRGSLARNLSRSDICATVCKYPFVLLALHKGSIDDPGQHSYRFDNARMTESCRVGMGPLPLLAPSSSGLNLGLGGRNQIEVCDVA